MNFYPTILALETSTDACSVALWMGEECLEEFVVAPRQHAQLVLQQIDRLLAAAGISLTALDGVAFGRGPGSFTGLRLASSVAQGLAMGADLPLIPISTLQALAQKALDVSGLALSVAIVDARLEEVYWGVYEKSPQGNAQAKHDDQLTASAKVTYPEQAFAVAGTGWDQIEVELLPSQGVNTGILYPAAREVGYLARWVRSEQHAPTSIETFLPSYLRMNVAKVKK